MQFHKRYPDRESRLNLIDLLVYGPVGHLSTVRFPDAARTRVGTEIVACFLQAPETHKVLATELVAFGWEKLLLSIASPVFCAEGDNSRTNHDALWRLADSLFVKSHSIQFLVDMLEYEKNTCHESSKAMLADKVLLSDIALRIPDALDLAIKALCRVLIYQGPFLTQSTGHLCELPDGPTSKCLEQVTTTAEPLMRAMAKVVSIFLWIDLVVESPNIQELGHQVADIVLKEIWESSFDPWPFLDKTNSEILDYWETIKLRFVTCLDSKMLSPLLPILAQNLAVGCAFDLIYG